MEQNAYTPLEQFIADITAGNYFKDNPHLVDEASIARWVYMKLKNFGRNIMDKYERTIHISDYRGEVPENFSSLVLAVFCEPDFASFPKGSDLTRVQSRIYGEQLKCFEDKLCEECTPQCKEGDCVERIVENLYLENTKMSFYYKNPVYVRLGKDLIRSQCDTNCINRSVKDSPYSINIKGKTVYANFKKGTIYLQYYGIPMDDDCLPVIPVTKNGYLEEYLEYHVKRKILEDAMLSDDSPNKQGIYKAFFEFERDLEPKAKADTSNIDMVALFRAMGTNRFRMHKYDVNLGAIKSNYDASGPAAGYGSFQNPNPFRF